MIPWLYAAVQGEHGQVDRQQQQDHQHGYRYSNLSELRKAMKHKGGGTNGKAQ